MDNCPISVKGKACLSVLFCRKTKSVHSIILSHEDLPTLLPTCDTTKRKLYYVQFQQTTSIVSKIKAKYKKQCGMKLLHVVIDAKYCYNDPNTDGTICPWDSDYITMTLSKTSVGIVAICCFHVSKTYILIQVVYVNKDFRQQGFMSYLLSLVDEIGFLKLKKFVPMIFYCVSEPSNITLDETSSSIEISLKCINFLEIPDDVPFVSYAGDEHNLYLKCLEESMPQCPVKCWISKGIDSKLFISPLAVNIENLERKIDFKGYVHRPVGKSNCCKRANAGEATLYQSVNCNKFIFKRQRTSKKEKKKKKLLEGLESALTKPFISIDNLINKNFFFYNFEDDPVINILRKSVNKFEMEKVNDTNFNIVNTTNGAKLLDKDGTVIFLLTPRDDALREGPSPWKDTKVLTKILNDKTTKLTRGAARQGVSTHYATLGSHAHRKEGGIYIKTPKTIDPEDETHLKHMMNRVFNCAKSYLPFGMLSGLEEMKRICDDDSNYVELPPNKSKYSTIWSSLAMTFNYMSPAHTDDDSFLSALVISYSPKVSTDVAKQETYLPTMDIAAHFCFPTHGVAVALRPGDVLFFNPKYYHCMSQRDAKYKADEVFITSFYLKNRQLSKNLNKISLSDEVLLQCDFFDQYLNNKA